jgi:hypothetical protein
MAKITISDLNSSDSENLLNELSQIESRAILGGETQNFSELVQFGIKTMEFILLAYAIDSISHIATSFNNPK